MKGHKLSQKRMEELEAQRQNYLNKLETKIMQIEEVRSSTIDFAQDPSYAGLVERKECYEQKISQIDEILSDSEVLSNVVDDDTVDLGDKVVIKNHSHSHEFILVDEAEADPCLMKIPTTSPIGRVVLGKRLNDEFQVETPGGIIDYKVISIEPAF